MRRGLRLAVALVVAIAGPVAAQQGDAGPGQTPVLTISPDGLFADTLYGQAVQARLDEAARALQEENRESEAALAAEEQALTNRRATLPPAEFRVLAEAFDRKANGIRETQAAKARAITEMRDSERQRFFEAVLPVLGQIMTDNGAVAIIDQSTVFLSFDRIDITAIAIARIDTLLGSGPDATPNPAGAQPAFPVPDAAPGAAAGPLPLGTPVEDGAPPPANPGTAAGPAPAGP